MERDLVGNVITRNSYSEWLGGSNFLWSWNKNAVLEGGWTLRRLQDSFPSGVVTRSPLTLTVITATKVAIRESGYLQQSSSFLNSRVHLLGECDWTARKIWVPILFRRRFQLLSARFAILNSNLASEDMFKLSFRPSPRRVAAFRTSRSSSGRTNTPQGSSSGSVRTPAFGCKRLTGRAMTLYSFPISLRALRADSCQADLASAATIREAPRLSCRGEARIVSPGGWDIHWCMPARAICLPLATPAYSAPTSSVQRTRGIQ